MSPAQRELSKFLSYVLRHEPESHGLQLDSEGWTDIDALLRAAAQAGRHTLDRAMLADIVRLCDKQRFAISEDGQRIRAVQGHSSTQVQRSYPEATPPHRLYHGTATRFLDSIRAQGLQAGQRHHVHLSAEPETARAVGQRYGKVVILEVDTQAMRAQGHRFWLAENGVWLAEQVPPIFLRELT